MSPIIRLSPRRFAVLCQYASPHRNHLTIIELRVTHSHSKAEQLARRFPLSPRAVRYLEAAHQ